MIPVTENSSRGVKGMSGFRRMDKTEIGEPERWSGPLPERLHGF